jgi:hypothetical protein
MSKPASNLNGALSHIAKSSSILTDSTASYSMGYDTQHSGQYTKAANGGNYSYQPSSSVATTSYSYQTPYSQQQYSTSSSTHSKQTAYPQYPSSGPRSNDNYAAGNGNSNTIRAGGPEKVTDRELLRKGIRSVGIIQKFPCERSES